MIFIAERSKRKFIQYWKKGQRDSPPNLSLGHAV